MELYDLTAEQAALGAIKKNNQVLNNIDLDITDFFIPAHKKIYEAMLILFDRGVQIDDVSLFEELQNKVAVSILSGIDNPTAANIHYYVDIIKEYSKKRKIYEILETSKRDINKNNVKETVDYIEEGLSKLYKDRKDYVSIKEMIKSVDDNIEKIKSGKDSRITTGFQNLNNLIDGFTNGEINIIAARANIGKSALALCMARNIIYKDYKVGFFSLEMSKLTMGERMMSIDSYIPHKFIKTGNFDLYDRDKKYKEAKERMFEKQLFLDDTPNIRLSELKSKLRQMKREGVDIVFIDYLSLITYNIDKKTYEKIGDIVKILRGIARELEIPIVLLAQINRQGEGKMPKLSDLAQSGEIEQHADLIMFIHRERGDEETYLKVVKNRNGPTGTVNLIFQSEYTKFIDK